MSTGIALATALLVVAVQDFPKPEEPPAHVRLVLDKYLKAAAAKDVQAMGGLADVPWLSRDRSVVRGRAELSKAIEHVAGQLPADQGQRRIESFPYKKLRGGFKDETLRKLFDEIVGNDGWVVDVLEEGFPLAERTILIRAKGDKVAVVGGPLKRNQVTPTNRIPEVVDRMLGKSSDFQLFSLDPEKNNDDKVVEAKDSFHGWKVLGKTEVKAAADRKRLVESLRLGAEDNFGVAAACFIPRHGIRLEDGGERVELVICFECLYVQVFRGGEPQKGFLTTGEPQKAFDAVLKAAGVKLPKQKKQ